MLRHRSFRSRYAIFYYSLNCGACHTVCSGRQVSGLILCSYAFDAIVFRKPPRQLFLRRSFHSWIDGWFGLRLRCTWFAKRQRNGDATRSCLHALRVVRLLNRGTGGSLRCHFLVGCSYCDQWINGPRALVELYGGSRNLSGFQNGRLQETCCRGGLMDE